MRYIVYRSAGKASFFDKKLKKAFKIDEDGDLFAVNIPVKIDSEEAFLKYVRPFYMEREETDKWPYKGERYMVAICDDTTRFFDKKEQAAFSIEGGKEVSFRIRKNDNFVHHVEQFGISDFSESNERPTA